MKQKVEFEIQGTKKALENLAFHLGEFLGEQEKYGTTSTIPDFEVS